MIKLDSLQRGVVDTILRGEVSSLYLTGEGGSGKSAIIKQIIAEAGDNNRTTLVLAPTNAAANNIDGITIHKAFGLNLEVNEDAVREDEVHIVRLNRDRLMLSFDKLNIKPSTIIIIDEISMGGGLLAKVIGLLRKYEKEKGRGLSTLMLVGDPKQLPPVKDNIVDWGKKCNVTVTLTKNYRTTNAELAAEIANFRDTRDPSIIDRVDTLPNVKKLGNPNEYTFIAYKNSTLASLQSILLGDDVSKWVNYGDTVQVFGTSTEHTVQIIVKDGPSKSVPYFVNGDDLTAISHPEKLGPYKGLYAIEVYNPKHGDAEVISGDYVRDDPTVITGDYKEYKKALAELFHPINEFKKEVIAKYGVAKAYDLKKKFTIDEHKKWNSLWSRFFSLKSKPFARHVRFITSHKAQGKSIDNVCVMWDELAGDSLKYVAISRARQNLVLITRKGKK